MRNWWSPKKYELLREAHVCPWLCNFRTQWPCHEDDLTHMMCSSGFVHFHQKESIDTLYFNRQAFKKKKNYTIFKRKKFTFRLYV